ncbi:MAG: alpha-L-fucosidase [Planctomycetota bacterium]|jgi:alpha-L-fucosidase
MKRLLIVGLCVLLAATFALAQDDFEPSWESLSRQEIPQWVKDAKFGVYTHWGVYSVPAHGGPDYVRNLYEGSKTDKKGVFSYHTKKYGPLDKFGYKDFILMFTALKFDADEWVGLMHEAGAKFGGICLVHHDGFLLWNSTVNRWNSANMGPKRDIFGEIARAVRKYDDMKLIATFHHARSFGYSTGAMKEEDITDRMRRTWDVFDPQYSDFYWNEATGTPTEFSRQWKAKIIEVIDSYKPDMIWFDGLRTSMRNDHPPESYVQEVIAHYYNSAAAGKQDVIVCNKHGGEFNFPESVGLRCFENGRDMPIDVGPWFLIDRAIAYPWSYVNNKRYRDGADYHVRSIVDVVSRGGVLLLSLTPKGDGSIPKEEKEIVRGIGRWMKVNGEAIYSTRPWKIFAEGPTVLRSMKKRNNGQVSEQWDWRKKLTSKDIRFTTKGDVLYAIALAWPEDGRLTVRSLGSDSGVEIGTVVLLGHELKLSWKQTSQGLEVRLPTKRPCEYAYALKITEKN